MRDTGNNRCFWPFWLGFSEAPVAYLARVASQLNREKPTTNVQSVTSGLVNLTLRELCDLI
jgi:hypothetical protein